MGITLGMNPSGVSHAFDLRQVGYLSPSEDVIGAPRDRVWNALPTAWVALDLPLRTVNAEAHLLDTELFEMRRKLGVERVSSFVNCGRSITGDLADRYEVYFRVLTQLKPAESPDSTHVITLVKATAHASATTGNLVRCSSTGRLERALLESTRVEAHLATGDGGG